MVDGTVVPSFIQLLEPENGNRSRKVWIYADEEQFIGDYELKIVTTLADDRF